jgi:hypothetical protein
VARHRLPALVLARGPGRLEVRRERHLRVHDDRAPARQLDDHVGTQAAGFRLDGHLLDVVAVLGHPGELDHPMQGHLTPAAAHLGRAERVDEIAGLALESLAEPRQPLDLGSQAAVRLIARLLQPADFDLVALERGFEGSQARVDLLLAPAEPLLGELEELGIARAECPVAESFEGLLEVHPRLVEDATLLVEALARFVEPRVRVGALATLGRDLAAHAFELEGALSELAPELVAAGFQLTDPDVAGSALVAATRAEVCPGGEPRHTSAEGEPDDDQRGFKHGARPSPASGGKRS